MFDGIINAINDFFRGILYGLAECFMFILDIVWEIALRVIRSFGYHRELVFTYYNTN